MLQLLVHDLKTQETFGAFWFLTLQNRTLSCCCSEQLHLHSLCGWCWGTGRSYRTAFPDFLGPSRNLVWWAGRTSGLYSVCQRRMGHSGLNSVSNWRDASRWTKRTVIIIKLNMQLVIDGRKTQIEPKQTGMLCCFYTTEFTLMRRAHLSSSSPRQRTT